MTGGRDQIYSMRSFSACLSKKLYELDCVAVLCSVITPLPILVLAHVLTLCRR